MSNSILNLFRGQTTRKLDREDARLERKAENINEQKEILDKETDSLMVENNQADLRRGIVKQLDKCIDLLQTQISTQIKFTQRHHDNLREEIRRLGSRVSRLESPLAENELDRSDAEIGYSLSLKSIERLEGALDQIDVLVEQVQKIKEALPPTCGKKHDEEIAELKKQKETLEKIVQDN